MNGEGEGEGSNNRIATALHHFQVVSHNVDGSFLLGSSALTGNIWDGEMSVFNDHSDYLQCPNLTMVAHNTSSGVNDALWLPGGMTICGGLDSGCLEVFQLQQKMVCSCDGRVVQAHDDVIVGVALLAGGSETVVSVSLDTNVVVSDLTCGAVLNTYRGHSDGVLAVAPHPTSVSVFITSSRDGCIRLWDTRKPTPASTIESHVGMCTALAWANTDENRIATGGQKGRVVIMDLRKGEGSDSCLHKYQPHSKDITKLTFAPWNCNILASGSEDTTVKVYSLSTQSELWCSTQHSDYVQGLSWHPSKPYLLSCGWDGQLLLHNITTDKSTAGAPVAMETSQVSDPSTSHEQ